MLKLSGRLDTATSMQTSNDIDELLNTAGTIQRLTIDAGELEYIASSGLRILLTLAKRYKDFRIIDVSPEVYDVLNMTGFTKIMNVERALRQLSIEGCEMIGVGGVGTVYRLDGNTIITVFKSNGAKVFTKVPAMEAFIPARDWISPASLWEKNSMGSRSTFHMYVVLPMTAILPLIRSE